jgi:hypothetical protein
MSTTFDDSGLDPKQVEEDMHRAVRRCRTSIRQGRQLLKLTQTERPRPD